MDALTFVESREAGALILAIRGEVNITTAPTFQTRLREVAASGQKRVILDLEQTRYIGSSGLGAILELAKDLAAKGGSVCLARVHYLNREVMEFFGLVPMVKVCDSIPEALKALGLSPSG